MGINGRTGRTLNLARFPHDWPRTVHASLIKRLVAQNAGGIVFDIDFNRSKSGDEDAILARAIADADRVVLFEWLGARREQVVTAGGKDAGWNWVEQLQAPTEIIAAAAKALGPFPLPKLDQAAFEFWAFKSSAGDAPTTAAVALQLKALPVYDAWLAVLKEAGATVEHLPSRSAQLRGPGDMQQLMQMLRQMFQQDASLQQRVEQVLAQDGERLDIGTCKLLAALAALYGGPDHYYINFYGPPGRFPLSPMNDFWRRTMGRLLREATT